MLEFSIVLIWVVLMFFNFLILEFDRENEEICDEDGVIILRVFSVLLSPIMFLILFSIIVSKKIVKEFKNKR